MTEIVLATGNPHKVEELRAVFAHAGVKLVGLEELGGGFNEPFETGQTFEENATIKALGYAAQTGRVCLADDSGLEVDALGGRPGVISSHYSTDGRETGIGRAARDTANNERLLRELRGVKPEDRTARFVCVMVLAGPDGRVLATSRGTFEGWIGLESDVPRGTEGGGGFGYDPLFVVDDVLTGPTSAELSKHEKNRRSHRGRAAMEMVDAMKRLGLAAH